MKKCMQTDLEKHYVIVGEPGEFYLSHVTPETGTGLYIAQSIYKAVKDTECELNLSIIGSDGTATMTVPLEVALHYWKLYSRGLWYRPLEPYFRGDMFITL